MRLEFVQFLSDDAFQCSLRLQPVFGDSRQDARLSPDPGDRKSTRLNSSHGYISYAVFCLKKKNRYVFIFRTVRMLSSIAETASRRTSLRRAIPLAAIVTSVRLPRAIRLSACVIAAAPLIL